jgi:parallel beta-helix repeat protein
MKEIFVKCLVFIIAWFFIGANVTLVGTISTEKKFTIDSEISSENFNSFMIVFVDDDYNETNIPEYGIKNFSKIQNGIDAVNNIGTVYVYNGNYNETVNLNKPIKLIGENKDSTYIDGERKTDVITLTKESDGAEIIGFTIMNSSIEDENKCGIKIKSETEKTLIHENNIKYCNTGIYINGIEDIKTRNNVICHNTIENFNNNGIKIDRYASNNQIFYNTITGVENMSHRGIYVDNSGSNIIYQNEISRCNRCVYIHGAKSGGNVIYYNNISSCGKYGVYTEDVYSGNFILTNRFKDCGTNKGDRRPASFKTNSIFGIYLNQIYLFNYWEDYSGTGLYRIYGILSPIPSIEKVRFTWDFLPQKNL